MSRELARIPARRRRFRWHPFTRSVSIEIIGRSLYSSSNIPERFVDVGPLEARSLRDAAESPEPSAGACEVATRRAGPPAGKRRSINKTSLWITCGQVGFETSLVRFERRSFSNWCARSEVILQLSPAGSFFVLRKILLHMGLQAILFGRQRADVPILPQSPSLTGHFSDQRSRHARRALRWISRRKVPWNAPGRRRKHPPERVQETPCESLWHLA